MYHAQSGLVVRRLFSPPIEVEIALDPFRSRGPTCRRVLARLPDARQFILEFASFDDAYGDEITGAIRSNEPIIDGDCLRLTAPRFRLDTAGGVDPREASQEVVESWTAGIRYNSELLAETGETIREGLRPPQVGALHAIASHWTLSRDPACVVLPTGTGKTEVMIATAIGARCRRLLVIVPTDALRQQTADRFKAYSILGRIGIIDQLPYPVVGILASRPTREHFPDIQGCNVVITTMSSIGLADEDVQRDFAALFDHVFFDEAHHIEAATWKRFQRHCRAAKMLLLTATPFREDGKSLPGKMIYNFPLNVAQAQGYFRPIRFVEVFEPNEQLAHGSIAEAAVARLRDDLAAGHDHILMARARTIPEARVLFETIYAPRYGELNPVLIHSQTPGRDAVLRDIRSRRHRVVVCVNMFGEGFDLPNLKIAALHSVHKSIGATLQFIGRFARDAAGVGDATFVANTAEDGVPEALETLYREDADWNVLLPDLSYDAIDPQVRLSDLVGNLEELQEANEEIEISVLALRPKISAQVYRAQTFRPEQFANAFRASQKVLQTHLSRRDNLLVAIVNQQDQIDWTDSHDIAIDTWDLYIAYFDPGRNLLYIHSSQKGGSPIKFAHAVSQDPLLIRDEEVFKAFTGLKRLTLHNVGLSSRSRNVRYQMFAGLDVRDAIDPVQQQSKVKSNITAVGYEQGERRSVGCSRKGKVWSLRSGSLADWKTWCDVMGAKLTDPNSQPNDFLRYTLVPTSTPRLPQCQALMADWPDQLFESMNFRFEVIAPDRSYEFDECQIDLVNWAAGGDSFEFSLRAGEDVHDVLRLRLEPDQAGEESYVVELVEGVNPEIAAGSGRKRLVEFFNENPPLVRLEDGSQLAGNILLRPQEDLGDTYDRERIQTLDWAGCDITKESRWKDGAVRPDSVQQRFIEHLEAGDATFIIDDDDTGESADIVAIEEEDERIIVHLWHCKYSSGPEVGNRVKDLYEVCGQAQKSAKWTWSLRTLIKHLTNRETKYANGRPTRFVRGSLNELVTLRKSSRRKFVEYRVGIVQPGLSKANMPTAHLAMLGATSSFIQCVTDRPLAVFAGT
ncbi:DEAD/DEAH box helicase [Thalassobaculum salexigens]|uniref:DEAD/DEAH box helicase n=1 Tax=Thalassobaculum salexigens TaxID=455360 RepID=UPI00146C5A7C|nr:DEAD/DEAH box helicase family protein [Thalassobaculum salexigens]